MAEPENTARPASEERGELTLTLEGAEYVLRPTYEAIDAFEGKTGRGLLELAQLSLTGKLRMGELAQVAAECIRAWGRATEQPSMAAVNARRVAELIVESEGGMAVAIRVIGTMLSMAATGGYTAQGEAKAGTTTTDEAPAES